MSIPKGTLPVPPSIVVKGIVLGSGGADSKDPKKEIMASPTSHGVIQRLLIRSSVGRSFAGLVQPDEQEGNTDQDRESELPDHPEAAYRTNSLATTKPSGDITTIRGNLKGRARSGC